MHFDLKTIDLHRAYGLFIGLVAPVPSHSSRAAIPKAGSTPRLSAPSII